MGTYQIKVLLYSEQNVRFIIGVGVVVGQSLLDCCHRRGEHYSNQNWFRIDPAEKTECRGTAFVHDEHHVALEAFTFLAPCPDVAPIPNASKALGNVHRNGESY